MGGIDLEPKMLQLLKETVPRVSRVALLYPTPWLEGRPIATVFNDQFAAADTLRITLLPVGVDSPEQYPQAFATMAQQRADALLVHNAGLNFAIGITSLTSRPGHRLPSISMFSDIAETGGLIAYGASVEEDFRRAATYVDMILKGARPARSAHRAIHDIQARHQPEDREGPRPHDPAGGARAGG